MECERGAWASSACVQLYKHAATRPSETTRLNHRFTFTSVCLSVTRLSICLPVCLLYLLSVCYIHYLSHHCPSFFPSSSFPPSFLLPFNHSFTFPSLPSFLPYFPSPPFLPPCLLSFPSYLVLSSLISPTFVFLPSSVSFPAFPSFLISFPYFLPLSFSSQQPSFSPFLSCSFASLPLPSFFPPNLPPFCSFPSLIFPTFFFLSSFFPSPLPSSPLLFSPSPTSLSVYFALSLSQAA